MNRQHLSFTVSGVEPAPQGSKRHVGNGRMVEASKKVAPFRKAIADAVFSELVATGDDRVFTDPVVVWATFFLPKPSTVKRLLPWVQPDVDKLSRSLLDGMEQNAGVLASDALVLELHARKVYAAVPSDVGVRVQVKALNEEEQMALWEKPLFGQCDFCGK